MTRATMINALFLKFESFAEFFKGKNNCKSGCASEMCGLPHERETLAVVAVFLSQEHSANVDEESQLYQQVQKLKGVQYPSEGTIEHK